jgi:hypothetical protein
MKFGELVVGAGFEYRGRTYVKTGPLTAQAAEGGDRIIPRSARVEPNEAVVAAAQAPLSRGEVGAAVAAFEEACLRCLDRIGARANPDAVGAARAELERAGRDFRARLGLSADER